MTRIVAAVSVMLLSQGCYLGRSRPGKVIAYVVNGALVTGGVVLAATPDPTCDQRFCFGPLITHSQLAVVPIVLGVLGLVVNVATTQAAAQPPRAEPAAPIHVRTTAPGLALRTLSLEVE